MTAEWAAVFGRTGTTRRVYTGYVLIGANVGLLGANVWLVLFGPWPLLSAAFVVVSGIGLSLAIYGTRHAWMNRPELGRER